MNDMIGGDATNLEPGNTEFQLEEEPPPLPVIGISLIAKQSPVFSWQ